MHHKFKQSAFSPARQPFLYLSAALLAGILIDRSVHPLPPAVVASGAVSFAASIALLQTKRHGYAAVTLTISFAVAGCLLSFSERTKATTGRLLSLYETNVINSDEPVELTGKLVTPPEPAPGACYLDTEAEGIRVRDDVMPATGRARLMIMRSDDQAEIEFADLHLDYGSRIRVLMRLERAHVYANPGSPDFNEFLERHGYDLKGVIKSPLLIERISDGPRNPALAFLYHLRLRIMRAIDSTFESKIAGTLKAMLTGNRYFLDPETVERLREGSTFHTLVIAGLHIGIIAWALLGGRSALKRRRVARVIVCLLILWAYAIMVGLAPPVTRATTMITLGLLGPLVFRSAASINTVALAAFVMLALKPALVADPGFQLSFVAVAGIVALALPLAEKLRQIGEWRPTAHTPHPPSCAEWLRSVAEALFWNERAFIDEMRHSPIRYRLKKAGAATMLGRFRVQPVLRGAVLLMITSASIQLTTLPLMALYFNRVAPIGVLLNVIAGLLTGVLILAASGAIVLGLFSEWIAAAFAPLVNAAHYLLVNAIAPFADMPLATFRVAHYEGWHTIIYALYFVPLALLAVLLDRWKPVERLHFDKRSSADTRTERANRSERPRKSISASGRLRFATSVVCLVALASAEFAVVKPPSDQATGKLTIHFLDVDQGDSALVVFPHGKTMLVDGGGEIRHTVGEREPNEEEPQYSEGAFSIGESVVSRFIWSLGGTRVDYVLVTHAHADHIGGLCDVIRNMNVGQGVVGHEPTDEPEYERFTRAANRRGVPLYSVSAGERFEIDGVTIDVLWPTPASEPPVTSGNNDSVVLKLVYGSVTILLAGDIEQATEDSLAASAIDLRADLLKVPHHGSRTSSTEAFVNAVNPQYAIISVGERSRFGHPHPIVVDRYISQGARLFQTGRDGTVTAETDGSVIAVSTYRSKLSL
ncbi:MAG TPA: ComEC/Rec2 family competence protein [Blastocatellia bacterium]